ncbi:MAG TPA: ABC transporter ATP-binding protein [Candidatus Eremiobacteraceae bacterium]|nr:ABC transporter ATP-binding protein [Candidatus Eremiobacteraceae bacterium]
MSVPLIEADHLSKRFGSTVAVNRLSFSVGAGEIFGFLGPNGAGKTTTIKMLTGLVRPTNGRARLNGFDIVRQPSQAKRVFGYVPDEPQLYAKLTAFEFLNFVGDVYEMGAVKKAARIRELLQLFDLEQDAGGLLGSFSHGMKQKVMLCSALLHEPKVYFLDEPTVGLDPRSAKLLKGILREIAASGGAIFMSTHIMEIAQALCDRIAILDKGNIVALGSMAELRSLQGKASLEDIFLHLTGTPEERTLASII